MKVTLGSIITSASGRLGGNIYAMAKGNCTMRNRGRKTTFFKGRYQLWARYNHNIVVAWRNMSPLNKQKWFEYAKTFFNDFKGKGTGSMSAYSVFTMLSRFRYYYNQTILLVPANFKRYSVPVIDFWTYSVNPATMSITLKSFINADSFLMLYATRPMLGSVNCIPNSFRYVAAFTLSTQKTVNLGPSYNLRFGSYGYVGACIYFKIVCISKSTGIPSAPIYIRLFSIS